MPATQTLQVRELPGYAQKNPHLPNDKALRVDWDGKSFALLYVAPTYHTLAWEGVVAFDRLENEFADALKALGWMNVNIREGPWRDRISVALVLPRSDGSDELVKCRLKTPGEYTNYTEVMKAPSLLSFARYDVFDNSGGNNPFFSFIAENPAYRPSSDSEVSLQLTKAQKWTDALLGWVFTHHHQSNLLTREVARAAAASVLNQHL